MTGRNNTRGATAVIAADSGEVIVSNGQEDRVQPIASLTKIMSLYVAQDIFDQYGIRDSAKIINITNSDLFRHETRRNLYSVIKNNQVPTTLSIARAREYSGQRSGGRSTIGLAVTAGRLLLEDENASDQSAYDRFVDAMNDKASDLGLDNTRFVDATGLSNGNVSTAREVASLLQAFTEAHPNDSRKALADTSGRHSSRFVRDNEGSLGKTGYTHAAEFTRAVIKGNMIAVVLGEDTNATVKQRLRSIFRQAKDELRETPTQQNEANSNALTSSLRPLARPTGVLRSIRPRTRPDNLATSDQTAAHIHSKQSAADAFQRSQIASSLRALAPLPRPQHQPSTAVQ